MTTTDRAPLDMDTYPNTPERLAQRELVRALDAQHGRPAAGAEHQRRDVVLGVPLPATDTRPTPSPLAIPREGYPASSQPLPPPTPGWLGDAANRRAETQRHRDMEARARAERNQRTRTPVPAEPMTAYRRPVLAKGDLVAGANAAADGVLLGWTGAGEMTRGRICAALAEAGVPVAWAPKSKSPRAHAGATCEALSSKGLVIRAERGRQRQAGVRDYDARWFVGQVGGLGHATMAPGADFGAVVMVATLRGDTLSVDAEGGWSGAAGELIAEYERRRDAEIYAAGEVTDWLRSVMRQELRGIPFARVWYVHNRYRAEAESLCNALAQTWGQDWLLPALPIATGDQLLAGLLRGLETEAREVIEGWRLTMATAQAERRSPGERAAGNALTRLTAVTDRVREYGALLGDERVRVLLAALRGMDSEIREHAGDTSARGAMLEF